MFIEREYLSHENLLTKGDWLFYNISPATANTTQTATLNAVAGAWSTAAPPVKAFTPFTAPTVATGLPVAPTLHDPVPEAAPVGLPLAA